MTDLVLCKHTTNIPSFIIWVKGHPFIFKSLINLKRSDVLIILRFCPDVRVKIPYHKTQSSIQEQGNENKLRDIV